MEKILSYDAEFEHTSEPRVRYVDRRDTRLLKLASDDSREYLRTVTPVPGHVIVLVLAMGATDYYGGNRNGDGFHEKPVYLDGRLLMSEAQSLPQHYKSFERGHNFLHHINRDPAKAVGSVRKAFWNEKMHRVELLVQTSEAKAPDIVRRIRDGESPGVSMGCKIDYDVCNICGHRAPTTRDYCDHVNNRDPRYGLGKILSDGRYCMVWNPSPRFFDISWVFKPADRIGYMLEKVAHTAPYQLRSSGECALRMKLADEAADRWRKLAELSKVLRGEAVAAKELEPVVRSARACSVDLPVFDEATLDALSRHPLMAVLDTLYLTGVHPRFEDIYRLVCRMAGHPPSRAHCQQARDAQDVLLGAVAERPGLVEDFRTALGGTADGPEIHIEIEKIARAWREKKALVAERMFRRAVPESPIGPELAELVGLDPGQVYLDGVQQTLHTQDPVTGELLETTLDVAEQTAVANAKRRAGQLAGLVGATALAYKGIDMAGDLTGNRAAGMLRFPVAAGGLGLTGLAAISGVPTVATAQGIDVPVNTPFATKVAGALEGTLLAAALLAADHQFGYPRPGKLASVAPPAGAAYTDTFFAVPCSDVLTWLADASDAWELR